MRDQIQRHLSSLNGDEAEELLQAVEGYAGNLTRTDFLLIYINKVFPKTPPSGVFFSDLMLMTAVCLAKRFRSESLRPADQKNFDGCGVP
jgi:hypothetical protein